MFRARYIVPFLCGALLAAGLVVSLGSASGSRAPRNGPTRAAVVPAKTAKPKGKATWIAVEANGTKARAYPETLTSKELFPGGYEVTSTANISDCAYIATAGTPGTGEAYGYATTAQRAGNSEHAVYVATFVNGEFVAEPFFLEILC